MWGSRWCAHRYCDKLFTLSAANQSFCSDECKYRERRERDKDKTRAMGRETSVCELNGCTKVFSFNPRLRVRQKYCCIQHGRIARRGGMLPGPDQPQQRRQTKTRDEVVPKDKKQIWGDYRGMDIKPREVWRHE